jgi:hypothetical protein
LSDTDIQLTTTMASSSTGRVPQGEVIMDVSCSVFGVVALANHAQFADGGSYIKRLSPSRPLGEYLSLGIDKLENAVLDLERRRITRDEGSKAQRAMEALELGKGPSSGTAKPEDVEFIVCFRYTVDL